MQSQTTVLFVIRQDHHHHHRSHCHCQEQLLSSSGEKVVPVRHDPPVQQQQGEPTNSFADVSLAGGFIFCLFTFFLFVVSLAGGFIFWQFLIHFFVSLASSQLKGGFLGSNMKYSKNF